MSAVRVSVWVEMKEDGTVRSSHSPSSREDQKTLQSWPSGGLVQLAHALLVEAIKRETYTMAISTLSSGVELDALTPEDLDARTRAHVIEMLSRFGLSAAEDVLKVIRASARGEPLSCRQGS